MRRTRISTQAAVLPFHDLIWKQWPKPVLSPLIYLGLVWLGLMVASVGHLAAGLAIL